MYSEENAKKKWCPQVRECCIASDCAMWRWVLSYAQATEINARGNAGAVASGYCGLAGIP
jgi:hypothetical protein